jgi:hypothetical protein
MWCSKAIGTLLLVVLVWLAGGWFVLVQPVMSPEKKQQEKQASQEALRQHVTVLASELPPRSHDADKLKHSADYIEKIFSTMPSARVATLPYDVWGIEYKNVLASFGPETGPRIIIGAHYDSHDGLPGADDNASGVAGLMELARMLEGEELSRRVDLIAYALEEMPSFRTSDMGSAHHATQLKKEGVEVELMISLEMIGYFDDTPGSQSYPLPFLNWIYPDRGNFIAVVGNLAQIAEVRRVKRAMMKWADIPVESINAPALIPGVDFSDHLNFWYEGYPAVMLTDTADNRNRAYHTPRDTPDRLDYRRMAAVVNGVYGLLLVAN